jgi:heme oxygenase (biliverdin-producing, ferredoxin)
MLSASKTTSHIDLSLSDALRERTAALHRRAEHSGIINDILLRRTDQRSYAVLLRNLLPAYRQMEADLERLRDNEGFCAFARPELRRADRITHDLEILCGADWKRELPLLSAGKRYAARVAKAGEGDGVRLMAHAYVRYFGDLSGGQLVARLLSTSLGLPPQALSFYDFLVAADVRSLKEEMRVALDCEGRNPNRRERIIEEGVRAFEHNIEVSEAVQALAKSPA